MVFSGDTNWRSARRARILAAAARVFAEQSFANASMDAIAAEAGFGKPTLYRYFAGKDELFGAVFADVLDRLDERLAAAFETGRATRPTLGAMLAEIVPTFREHLGVLQSLRDAEAAADRSRRRVFRDRRGQIAGWLARALDRGVAAGEIRPAATALVSQMALGMIRSATAATGADDRAIVDAMTVLLLDGLVPRAGGGATVGPEPADVAPAGPGRLDFRSDDSGAPAGAPFQKAYA